MTDSTQERYHHPNTPVRWPKLLYRDYTRCE